MYVCARNDGQVWARDHFADEDGGRNAVLRGARSTEGSVIEEGHNQYAPRFV